MVKLRSMGKEKDQITIRVAVRVRPLNNLERKTGQLEAWKVDGNAITQSKDVGFVLNQLTSRRYREEFIINF